MKFLQYLRSIFRYLIQDILGIFFEKDPLKFWKILIYFSFFLFTGYYIFRGITGCMLKVDIPEKKEIEELRDKII